MILQIHKNIIAVLLMLLVLLGGCSLKSETTEEESNSSDADTAGTDIYSDVVAAPTELPALFITLDDGKTLDNVGKSNYVSCTVSAVGSDLYPDIIDAAGGIKGRGNFSWETPKKPYNLKFETKTDLFGMGRAKKWVLIANYWDKTMLRNYITLTMAKEMGFKYALDVQFIDLYVGGKYMGNYLLSEKVETGKRRIKIEEKNGGVLFEIEQPYRHGDGAECGRCHEVASGVHLMYKEPEAGDIPNEQFVRLVTETNRFLDEMDASLDKGYDIYSNYIDVQSFVDWYILNEFCKNYDSQFVTSCYCYYDPADSKLHMGPPWDYDTCYGNQNPDSYGYPEDYFVKKGAKWYSILLEDKTFSGMVKARWTELKAQGVIANVLKNTISGAEMIDESQQLNYQVWPSMLAETKLRGDGYGVNFYTFKEEVDYLKKFIALRTFWLDEEWNTDFDSPENTIDNINILTKGLFLDNSMEINNMDKVRAIRLYRSLDDEQKQLLEPDVYAYYDG